MLVDGKERLPNAVNKRWWKYVSLYWSSGHLLDLVSEVISHHPTGVSWFTKGKLFFCVIDSFYRWVLFDVRSVFELLLWITFNPDLLLISLFAQPTFTHRCLYYLLSSLWSTACQHKSMRIKMWLHALHVWEREDGFSVEPVYFLSLWHFLRTPLIRIIRLSERPDIEGGPQDNQQWQIYRLEWILTYKLVKAHGCKCTFNCNNGAVIWLMYMVRSDDFHCISVM